MNAYFFKMTNEERDNILNQHKTIYDGYVTGYKNMNINEMRYDGKSTGLFSKEEPKEYGHISGGSIYEPEETFESEFEVVTDFSDDDDNFMVSVGAHRDMIGDGNHDLEHGVFGHEDEEDMVLISPEIDFDDEDDDELVFNLDDKIFDDEIDDEESEGLFDDLRESLDMFKRFTKYN